jgi:hypothetical protein
MQVKIPIRREYLQTLRKFELQFRIHKEEP